MFYLPLKMYDKHAKQIMMKIITIYVDFLEVLAFTDVKIPNLIIYV